MNDNQIIYGFDDSGCKHEVLSKKDVYTKTEIDNNVSNKISTTILKDDIAVIYAQTTIQSGMNHANVNLYYPEGFTCYNSVVIAKEYSAKNNDNYKVFIDSENIRTWNRYASMSDDGKAHLCTVILHFSENLTNAITYDIRVVLMKLPEYIENINYTLGDVNGDGQITINDVTKIQNYIQEEDSLTAQQFAAADIDKNGEVKASDYVRLKNYVEGTTSSLSD